MSQALARIEAQYAGHPFMDYFDCLSAALAAARKRNRQIVRAKLDGDAVAVMLHRHMRRFYMDRARQWHDKIDWSVVNG